jgi:hypothetical protein
VRLVEEEISNRVVVMKIAHGLDLKLRAVKPRTETNLARQRPSGIITGRRYDPGDRIPPFGNAAIVPKPLTMLRRVVALEADDRGD